VEPPSPLSSADPTSPHPQSPSQPELEPEPEPEPDPAAVAAEAEKLKEQGNESFKRGRYGEAVDLYTKAISASSSPSLNPLSSSFVPPSPTRFPSPLSSEPNKT
jgi:hypothetical protein